VNLGCFAPFYKLISVSCETFSLSPKRDENVIRIVKTDDYISPSTRYPTRDRNHNVFRSHVRWEIVGSAKNMKLETNAMAAIGHVLGGCSLHRRRLRPKAASAKFALLPLVERATAFTRSKSKNSPMGSLGASTMGWMLRI